MLRRTILKTAVVAVVPLATMLVTTSVASADPSMNLSFSASGDGASAGWSHGKGSPIDLTLGANSSSTFAVVTLHHVAVTAVADTPEPLFVTDNYAAGSPRYFVTLNGGDSLWGYPSNANLGSTGAQLSWAINNGNTYLSWAAVQASSVATETVTGAYIVADGDQAPGVTDAVSGISFDNTQFN